MNYATNSISIPKPSSQLEDIINRFNDLLDTLQEHTESIGLAAHKLVQEVSSGSISKADDDQPQGHIAVLNAIGDRLSIYNSRLSVSSDRLHSYL